MEREIIFPSKQKFALEYYSDTPLQANEIRGKTIVSLVSQGTEIGWANGDSFPIRPGYSAVFEVTEVGASVTGVKVGDLRFCMGQHRSTQTHMANNTLPVPNGLKPDHAVLARLMGVSLTTLMTTKARPGDRVVIGGLGPVGLLAAHLFTIGGYRVCAVDPDPLRRQQAQASGISDCREKMPLEDATVAGKVALVVDCSGHEAAVIDGCKVVRKLGEVVLVGVPWKKQTDLSAHEVFNAVFFNFVQLRSGWEWEVPLHCRDFVWEELLEGYNNAPFSTFDGFSRCLNWLAEGRINLNELIHYTNADNPELMYSKIMSREISEPFIVINWNER